MYLLAVFKIAIQEGHDCKSLIKLRAGSDNPVSLFSVDDRGPTIRGLYQKADHLHPHLSCCAAYRIGADILSVVVIPSASFPSPCWPV
jgi:hypothetical protein